MFLFNYNFFFFIKQNKHVRCKTFSLNTKFFTCTCVMSAAEGIELSFLRLKAQRLAAELYNNLWQTPSSCFFKLWSKHFGTFKFAQKSYVCDKKIMQITLFITIWSYFEVIPSQNQQTIHSIFYNDVTSKKRNANHQLQQVMKRQKQVEPNEKDRLT